MEPAFFDGVGEAERVDRTAADDNGRAENDSIGPRVQRRVDKDRLRAIDVLVASRVAVKRSRSRNAVASNSLKNGT